ERGPFERLDRHGETRSDGATSSRFGNTRSGRISLAPGNYGSQRRENFDLAGNKSGIRRRYTGVDQSGIGTERPGSSVQSEGIRGRSCFGKGDFAARIAGPGSESHKRTLGLRAG